jgi:hypothetical protein
MLHPADGAERKMLFDALDALLPQTDLLLDRGYIATRGEPRWRARDGLLSAR